MTLNGVLTNYTYVTPGGVIAAGAILPALGIVAVGLRFYCRRKQAGGLQTDDWLSVPGLVSIELKKNALCGKIWLSRYSSLSLESAYA